MSKKQPLKTVIVSSDIVGLNSPTGGISTFISHFSKLLLETEHDLTFVFAHGSRHLMDPQAWLDYRRKNIRIWQVVDPDSSIPIWPDFWAVRRSEEVASYILDYADVVYFNEWQGNGFHTLRQKYLYKKKHPVCVTVLHGGSEWTRFGMRRFPEFTQDLNLDFLERYSAKHADYVASPSEFLADWLRVRDWQFPQEGARVLGYPFTPLKHDKPPVSGSARQFRRLVYFGRLQTLKGFDLFVDALLLLKQRSPQCLDSIDEIVFLGPDSTNRFGGWEAAAKVLGDVGLNATHIGNLKSADAQNFLARNAHDSLVVIPSLIDNLPFSVIETSLIPNLNFICSNVGGIPEIVGKEGKDQLFIPDTNALVKKLIEWLTSGPRSTLGHYDYEAGNRRWLDFHEEVCEQARHVPMFPVAAVAPRLTIDVCIPYFNHPKFLPQLLATLEHQTVKDFGVIVVDDGSTMPEAQTVFVDMAQKYGPRGWRFIRQENAYVGATRNRAASESQAEYLCFIDADDIAAPNMVEQFRTAMSSSKADCLSCYAITFSGDEVPYDTKTGRMTTPPHELLKPFGNNLAVGLVHNVLGNSVILIKHTVFDQLKGYMEDRNFTYDDYEFHARIALEGYETDVVPEYLYYYRILPYSRLRTVDLYNSQVIVQDTFQRYLSKIHLGPLAGTVLGMHEQIIELQLKLAQQASQVPGNPPSQGVQTQAGEMIAYMSARQPVWLAQRIPYTHLVRALLMKTALLPRKAYRKIVPTPIRLRLRNIRQSVLKMR